MEYNVERIRDTLYRIEDIVSQDREVNWEQARVDAAIGAMQGKLADHTAMLRLWHGACEDTSTFHRLIVKSAVQLADALIAELKKKGE